LSIETLIFLVSTGFGLGLSPVMPGTLGSLLGLPLALWLATQRKLVRLGYVVAAFIASAWVSQIASRQYGGGDAQLIVIDEYLAFPLTLIFFKERLRILFVALAFIVYRAFDILKPFPIPQVEVIGGGIGIALDDVLAAAYAAALLALMRWVWLRRTSDHP